MEIPFYSLLSEIRKTAVLFLTCFPPPEKWQRSIFMMKGKAISFFPPIFLTLLRKDSPLSSR